MARSLPTRLLVVLAAFVFALAGVPIWWKLTEIYRTPLPYSEIEELSHRATNENLALPVHLQVVFFSRKSGGTKWDMFLDKFSKDLEQQLNEVSKLDLTITLDTETGCSSKGDHQNWDCGLDIISVDDTVDEVLRDRIPSSSVAGFYTIAILLDTHDTIQAVLGKYRHAWITGQSSDILEDSRQLIIEFVTRAAKVMLQGSNNDPGKTHLMPLAADATATLSFSLLNANPENWIYDWDFESLENRFLLPIVNMLSPVANLSVESQVLYYTPSTGRSRWDSKLGSYVVQAKDTSFFINANEWHLDTSTAAAGRSKILHFAVYVPAANECPLRFKLPNGKISTTNAFTSPGWGGVVVWNPRNCSLVNKQTRFRLTAEDLKPTMGVILAQLRTLFGLPPVSSFSTLHGIPNFKTGFADWEIDILIRRRSVADADASASTLASLSRLVKSLPNMVIQDEIGAQVQTSLKSVHEILNIQELSYAAYSKMAREARKWSEAAFFHPSIMSLLHFPKAHRAAIYLPFFAPMLLNTFLFMFKEMSRYFRKDSSAKKLKLT